MAQSSPSSPSRTQQQSETQGGGHESEAAYNALVVNGNGANLVRDCLMRRQAWRLNVRGEDAPGSWNLWWGSNCSVSYCPFKRLVNGHPPSPKLINRLPGVQQVATKARLAFHLTRHLCKLGRPVDCIPETHVVTARLQIGKEKERLMEAEQRSVQAGQGSVYIVKPDNRNKGQGITVHSNMASALDHINSQGAMGSCWIIQKYIERPLLLGGRKFDIRTFVLCGSRKQAWMHNQSYVRTSSAEFTLQNLEDRSIHLTNDAVQKHYQHYNSFEDHNKLDLASFQDVLDQQGIAINVEDDLLPQMRSAAADVFSATLPWMNLECLQSCFELFGLDFMVDECGKVYLIEVNSCPALAMQGKVLSELLPLVIEECFQKAVDSLFPGSCSSMPPLHDFQLLPIDRSRRPPLRTYSRLRSQITDGSPSPDRKLVKASSCPMQDKLKSMSVGAKSLWSSARVDTQG